MKIFNQNKPFSLFALFFLSIVSVPNLEAMQGHVSCATVVSSITKPTPFKVLRDLLLPFAKDRKPFRMNALSTQPSRLVFTDYYNEGPARLAKLLKNTNWEKSNYASNDLLLLFANNLADFWHVSGGQVQDPRAYSGLQSFLKKMLDTADQNSATRLWEFVEKEMAATNSNREEFLRSDAMKLMYDLLFDLEVKTKGSFEGPLAQSLLAIPQFTSHIARINELGLSVSESDKAADLGLDSEARKIFSKGYFSKNNELVFMRALEKAIVTGKREELYDLLRNNGVGARTIQGLGVDYFLQGTIVHQVIAPEQEALDVLFKSKSNESFVVGLFAFVFQRRISVAMDYPFIPSGRSLRAFPMEPLLTQGVHYIESLLHYIQKNPALFDQRKMNNALKKLMSVLDAQRLESVASQIKEGGRDPEINNAKEFFDAFGIPLVDKTPINVASVLAENPEASAFLNALMDKNVDQAMQLFEEK